MSKVFIIGGPGNISSSTIQDLVERGWQVGLFSKPDSPFHELDGKVKVYCGNRDVSGELEKAFEDFSPDVLIDLACFLPEQAEHALQLAHGRVSHFIFASTVDVYGYPLSHLPMRESDRWQTETRSIYAMNKRACEQIFEAAFDPKEFPLTIVRPAYSFGPRFILSALDRAAGPSLLYHLQHEMPILVPGDGTTLIHASSGFNTGRMIAAMAGDKRTIGETYNCAHPTTMEYEKYIQMFARQVGKSPVLVNIPSEVILSVDDDAMKDNLLAELTRYNIFFSTEKFLATFPDFQFEPLVEAARRAVEWNVKEGRLSDKAIIDDRIITAYLQRMRGFAV